MIDFTPVNRDGLKLSDIQGQYTRQDLIDTTNEVIDMVLDLIRDLPDEYVTFQPIDPHAHDAAATPEEANIAWTLGHVIVHTTASSEEGAALGATLARGVEPTWRNRYEVPWETVTTIDQLVHRLEESRRIRLAYLNAWPDAPHLDVYFTKLEKHWGALNAVGYTMVGLRHEVEHLDQIKDIIAQASVAVR
jgi:hypothetical protein